MRIRIGTRASKLALIQTNMVISLLAIHHPHVECEVVPIVTTGDTMYDANLALIGGKGLFLKELEEHLLAGKIDFAVHSLKDVPAFLPEGLELSCFLERETPFDAFLSEKYQSLDALPMGAKVGTSSSRRLAQLRALRPDLEIIPFRGNVPTRIEKMRNGLVDACILACAGLKRLGLEHEIKQVFTETQMIPAIGQGVICIEQVASNDTIRSMLTPLNHKPTELCILAERKFMQGMSGNCTTPLAAHAVIEQGNILLNTMYYDDSKGKILNASAKSSIDTPTKSGQQCSKEIKRLLK